MNKRQAKIIALEYATAALQNTQDSGAYHEEYEPPDADRIYAEMAHIKWQLEKRLMKLRGE